MAETQHCKSTILQQFFFFKASGGWGWGWGKDHRVLLCFSAKLNNE